MHLSLVYCDGAHVYGVTTASPTSSPGTDSIHLVYSNNVLVEDSTLHGGGHAQSMMDHLNVKGKNALYITVL